MLTLFNRARESAMDAKKLQAARAEATSRLNQVKKQQADVEAARAACEADRLKLEEEIGKLDTADTRATEKLVERRRAVLERAQLLEEKFSLAAKAIGRVETECAAALDAVRTDVLKDLRAELKRAEEEARRVANKAAEEIAARVKNAAELAGQLRTLENEVARALGEVPFSTIDSMWAWVPQPAPASEGNLSVTPSATLIGAGHVLSREDWVAGMERVP